MGQCSSFKDGNVHLKRKIALKSNFYKMGMCFEIVCIYLSCEQVSKLLENIAMRQNDSLY